MKKLSKNLSKEFSSFRPFRSPREKSLKKDKQTLLTQRFQRYEGIISDFNEFLKSCESPPLPVLRINTLKGPEKALLSELKAQSINLEKIERVPQAYQWVSTTQRPGNLFQAAVGAFYIQALSSFFPSLWLAPKPGEKVLDLCAAPGGKTTHLAQLMNDEGLLIANDRQKKRIQNLNANLDRCGITNTVTTLSRGQDFPETHFDKVLVDAPCSAEGTYRIGKPILTHSKTSHKKKSFLETITSQQKGLLHRAFHCLKKGGELIYSTCTYAPEENEMVVQDLLQKEPGAELLRCEENWANDHRFSKGLVHWQSYSFSKEMSHCLRVYPHRIPSWGFFIAKVRKHD